METNFCGYLPIFTDESRILDPTPSTSAAFCVRSRNVTLSWKLPISVQILGAEIFAIYEALLWAETNLHNASIVFFTDSLSSLYLLRSRKTSHYLPRVFATQQLLMSLCTRHTVRLQYIPSHQGILGNELADTAAGEAHSLRYRTLFPLSFDDTRFLDYWYNYWVTTARATRKGLF